jgi:hypothetical protein
MHLSYHGYNIYIYIHFFLILFRNFNAIIDHDIHDITTSTCGKLVQKFNIQGCFFFFVWGISIIVVKYFLILVSSMLFL